MAEPAAQRSYLGLALFIPLSGYKLSPLISNSTFAWKAAALPCVRVTLGQTGGQRPHINLL